jgi:hypothetical protein
MSSSDITAAPAPWQLTGRGYIAALRFEAGVLEQDPFTPAELKGQRLAGNVGYIMLVDYSSSAVGPYYELLFIPGRFRQPDGKKRYSISRIFVSSEDSVVNGRRNWGIPKFHADFDLQYDKQGGVQAEISRNGQSFCRLSFKKLPGSLPVTTALVPPSLRTLTQAWEGQRFQYTPGASGWAGLAKLTNAWADPAEFADLAKAKPLLGVATNPFRMTFPISKITPITAA